MPRKRGEEKGSNAERVVLEEDGGVAEEVVVVTGRREVVERAASWVYECQAVLLYCCTALPRCCLP